LIYFTAWQDNKPVHMLSTFPPERQPILRHCKTKADGPYEQVRLWIPTNIPLYNRGMGGTDLIDQLASYYRTVLEAKRSTMRLFTHFTMVTMINAMILFRQINNSDVTLFKFLNALVDQLTGGPANIEGLEAVEARCRPNERLCGADHCLVKGLVDTRDIRATRKRCKVCSSLTPYVCDKCDVHLCLNVKGEQNCFRRYHTLPADEFRNPKPT